VQGVERKVRVQGARVQGASGAHSTLDLTALH
jgi:hypothetical protein